MKTTGETSAGPLRIDVLTLFPDMFRGAFEHSIIARAVEAGLVGIGVHDLRSFSVDPHGRVDDAPFGGGGGMVLTPDPLFRAVEAITGRPAGMHPPDEAVVLLTPSGERHDQRRARRLSRLSRLVLLCGRYEGVDDRVRTHLCSETLSIGDFVLSGGEPAAVVVVDSVVRLLPGALGNPDGATSESHERRLLEAPHFTRPASYRGVGAPDVLLSGHHEQVRLHRRREALAETARVRPDLLERAEAEGLLDDEEKALLKSLRAGQTSADVDGTTVIPEAGGAGSDGDSRP